MKSINKKIDTLALAPPNIIKGLAPEIIRYVEITFRTEQYIQVRTSDNYMIFGEIESETQDVIIVIYYIREKDDEFIEGGYRAILLKGPANTKLKG